jgi:hypothetical protein
MVTMHVRKIRLEFEWKSRFADRIISDGTHFDDVQRYPEQSTEWADGLFLWAIR